METPRTSPTSQKIKKRFLIFFLLNILVELEFFAEVESQFTSQFQAIFWQGEKLRFGWTNQLMDGHTL